MKNYSHPWKGDNSRMLTDNTYKSNKIFSYGIVPSTTSQRERVFLLNILRAYAFLNLHYFPLLYALANDFA
ncbi:MAG: hypothetical protein ACW96X_03495 [Promethearchaeota archaeon]